MITVEMIKDLIKSRIKAHESMITYYLNEYDLNKIDSNDLGLNTEISQQLTLKWLLDDIKDLENK
jgi:hypothetical protein